MPPDPSTPSHASRSAVSDPSASAASDPSGSAASLPCGSAASHRPASAALDPSASSSSGARPASSRLAAVARRVGVAARGIGRAVCAAGIAACGTGIAACGGGSPATLAQSAAPGAAAVIARSARQQIDSVDFKIVSLVPGGPGGPPITLAGTASLRLRPQLAGQLSFTTLGQTTTERIVGTSFYIYLPRIASHDGGRPWVLVDGKSASRAVGANYADLVQTAQRLDPTSTLGLLAVRGIFHGTGATTIAGQRVFGVTWSFTPRTVDPPGLGRDLVAQLKAKLVAAGATRETVTVDLSAAGVPVRIVTGLSTAAYGTLTSTIDINAINVPVVTAPPPASQTIDLARARLVGG